MPTHNLSDTTSVQTYATATNAILKIKSVTVAKSEVHFPAFLTDFSQNFDATWNTEEVFGRMDPIATYQGTKRTMSLGFEVPAGSLKGAKDNLERCEKLISMVYPVYNSFKTSDEKVTTTGKELYPKVISISFSFNILHEKTLSQGSTAMNNFPFGG